MNPFIIAKQFVTAGNKSQMFLSAVADCFHSHFNVTDCGYYSKFMKLRNTQTHCIRAVLSLRLKMI
jgi:hypothetical protein